MTYEAWRMSYQSSEAAARAAFAECQRLRAMVQQLQERANEGLPPLDVESLAVPTR